jgi:hypothetical protein
MISLSILCTVVGAVLGLRFKVLVLVPATLATGIVIATVSVSTGTEVWWTVILTVMGVTLLQLGYLGGAAISLWSGANAGALFGARRSPADERA